jgi:hypothetical protein
MNAAITILSSTAGRVGQLVRLLASDKPGEIVAAATALTRTLTSVGIDIRALADVVQRGLKRQLSYDEPEPDYTTLARRCWHLRHRLSSREVDFVGSMLRWDGQPTERQAAWLLAIDDRLGVRR